jgi:DMSO reductase anchor subunit
MSREFLAGTLFVAALILTSLFPHPVLRILGAGAALGLMLSQGFIVYSARGVPAWNVTIIPLVFLTSGFVSGGGLMFALLDWATTERSFAVMGIVCVAVNLVIWLLYLHWSFDHEFRQATEALRSPKALILTVGVGHFLPVCLLLLVVMRPGFGSGAGLPAIATSLAALAMITGSFRQNTGIILKAGYQKEIALERKEKGTHL